MFFEKYDMDRAIRFAGKFILVLAGFVTALWLVGNVVRISRLSAILVVVILAVVLYVTARHWIRWLPGLLIFGVLNSLVGLISHHAPTNPHVPVSSGVAGILLVFYLVGCVVSSQYNPAHLSVVDRCALLVYLFCMIWPAFVVPSGLGAFPPVLAWAAGVGVIALVIPLAIDHLYRTKRSKRQIVRKECS
jgi:hypothetical protein